MNPHHDQLLQLTYIRFLTLLGLSGALLFALFALQAEFNPWLVGSTLAATALMNAATFARLHSPWPVTEPELATHLVADLVLYGCLLYQTGGAGNPFIFLLLLPLIIAASTLSRRLTLLIALLAAAIYSSLLHYYIEILPLQDSHQHRLLSLFDLHITGMWLNFLLTTAILTYFIVRMRASMQQQQERLEQERERRLHDQQLLSLATMAAGTAHELGTPLSTMRVVLKELELDHRDDPALLEDLQLLQSQVDSCAERLQQLTRTVRDEQASQGPVPVDRLLADALEQWQLMRPEVDFQLAALPGGPLPAVEGSTSLRQALLNLLNNAADANPTGIRIQLDWDAREIWLRIHDQGPGLSLEQSQHLGKPFVTTKGRGLGIGLFLTATTLARHDGDVRLYNHPNGGTLTEVTLRIHHGERDGTASSAEIADCR
ncbi:ATP-binding protein [Marinobacterium arenosum]|uniref:ATP-binding protein n=1 Tax=Marinobacterium arenosum TaxID=2862496 RepID=UPI001C955876|nr:ATP-binding protein [Marinobacterium arenosum]MBY4676244.1 sensor histidine kinase [Marinobacterium arenosum]